MPINQRYLVEKKEPDSSDSRWYNLYSDGWCEQGGQIASDGTNHDATVTFLKPFIDTNYFFAKTNNNDYTSTYVAKYLNNVITYSTSQVVIGIANKETGNTHWRACGYTSIVKSQSIIKY